MNGNQRAVVNVERCAAVNVGWCTVHGGQRAINSGRPSAEDQSPNFNFNFNSNAMYKADFHLAVRLRIGRTALGLVNA
jgi:hypothetical protein